MKLFRQDPGTDPRDSRRQGPRSPHPRRPAPNLPPGRPFRKLALWVLVGLLALVFYRMYQGNFMTTPRIEVSYTRFIKEVEEGNIANLQIVENVVTGELKVDMPVRASASEPRFKAFRTNILGDGSNLPDRVWKTNPGIEIEVRSAGFNWVSFIFTSLPFLLLLPFWLLIMRQVQSGGSAALKFGKTKAKVLIESTPKVTFKDVAGCDEAKLELQEIIEFLKEPQKFQRLGGRIPKGALLLGPPGSGKTLLAKAVAGEAGVPFFSMSGSDFVEMFVGVGASVTGDTPVLVRQEGRTRLVPIGQYVDELYVGDQAGFVVQTPDLETLGYEERPSKFLGSPKSFFGGSAWKQVRGALRHKVSEIYEIHYLGGRLRTTGDHSLFVRTRNGIRPKAARDLAPGDILVNLPHRVRGAYSAQHGTPHDVRAHAFASLGTTMRLAVRTRESGVEQRFAFARAQQGLLSQAAIGAAVGVSQATVGHWQSGKHLPRELSDRYTRTPVTEEVEVTPNLLRLLGYYTAEGRDNGCLEFTFGAQETDLHHDVIDLTGRIFGVHAKVRVGDDNAAKITFHSASLGRFFSRHCGKGSRGKHVPEFLWDLPREYFDAYLTGYALGDGHVTKEGKLEVTSVSQRLICELAWLCAMHGIKTGMRRLKVPGGRVIKNRTLPDLTAWRLIIGKTSNRFVRDRANQAKRPVVRRVEVKPFDGYVYDFCGCDNEAFFGGEKPILLHNSRVRDLFEQGKRNAPCIVFIDEIDAVGRHRGAGLGGGHDEREQTLNQLLVEMDGFDSNEGVIILAATNRPDVLDPALLRPGRFDRQIVVDWPDVRGREGILKVHTRNIPLSEDVDLGLIARATPGMAGADLANMVNEAALLAARRNKKKVTMQDLQDAKDKVMLGMERKSLVMTEEERRNTAYHESGHALVAWLLPGSDPVDKVTIIPRGRALGVTSYVPAEERHARTRDDLLRIITMMMGGRAAEELVFGHLTTGAANDLERATGLARRMVCELGMSDKLGPLTFGKKEEMVFLGKEISSHKDYSENTAIAIDEEVRAIAERCYERAVELLKGSEDKLHLLARTLLEREVVDGDQMNRLLRGETLEPLVTDSDASPPAPAREEEPVEEKARPVEAFTPPPRPRPAGA